MTALVHDRAFDPRHGEAVEIAPGIRRITAANPGPFTFHGTNTYLVGLARVVVVDPGPDDAAHLAAVRTAVGDAAVAAVLVTHTHRDHSAGARAFARSVGAPVLSAGPHRYARPPRPGEAEQASGGDLDFVPDAVLADGDVVDGGDLAIEAVATPGHAENHLAFAVAGGGLMLSGDHVMAWSTTIVAPPDGSMSAYRRSLARIAARPERRYLPGHGGPVEDGPGYVAALLAHRAEREAAIIERLRAGDRTAEAIVASVYRDLAAALIPAAALSVLAHLEDLAGRGVAVLADGDSGLTARLA